MSEKPLQDLIICCTSVPPEERSLIMRQALEMGAVVQADLTSDVTHLIVAKLQTEKFRYAARHRTDLKLMTVDWVPALHGIWIAGRDVNLPWSEDKYRLPIFYGLRICVTNLDADLRSQIEIMVTQHGAHYSGDLTKENTHLIAGSASGKKFEAVNAWQPCDISIIGIEWVYESIKRGAALDEKFFRLELSPEVRGQNSWFPMKVVTAPELLEDASSNSLKRKRPQEISHTRKRLSKRASNLFDDGLWADILKKEDSTSELDFQSHHGQSDMLALAREESTASAATFNVLSEDMTRGIFADRSFAIIGFPARENAIVHRTLKSNGANIVENTSLADLVVVPQNGNPPQTGHGNVEYVTEFWLERCLALHRFEEPSLSFLSTPFSCSLPINRMDQLSICISGFSAVETMHIEKAIKMVGAVHRETLTRGRSILVASSRNCRKFQVAKDNGTRVVKVNWLWECITRGKLVGIADYALDGVEGSQCRIDGNVVMRQKRKDLMKDVVCHVSSNVENHDQLCQMAQSMGARLIDSATDSQITHIISDHFDKHLDRGQAKATQVSHAWISETFALMHRQPESSYLLDSTVNDENRPPVTDKAAANEMRQSTKMALKAISRRSDGTKSRPASRKIMGRASTMSQIDDMMMTTNDDDAEDDSLASVDTKTSQGVVTYSDPEIVRKQRDLLLKLGAGASNSPLNDSFSDMESSDRLRTASMRATGLDESRKLRK